MAIKGKIFVLIFVIAALIAAFWVINAQLNITTDTINQGIVTDLNQEASVNTMQSTPIAGMAISIVGAVPVEPVRHPVEKMKEKTVFQSENTTSGSANQAKTGSAAAISVSIKKEPASEKKEEMGSKGIIIF